MITEGRHVSSNGNTMPRPFWIPAGIKLKQLPQEAQAALKSIIQPAYQELVLEASSALESSAGLTVVHLLWLEIVPRQQNLWVDSGSGRWPS